MIENDDLMTIMLAIATIHLECYVPILQTRKLKLKDIEFLYGHIISKS